MNRYSVKTPAEKQVLFFCPFLVMTFLCQKDTNSLVKGVRGQIASPCVRFVSKRYEIANKEVRG